MSTPSGRKQDASFLFSAVRHTQKRTEVGLGGNVLPRCSGGGRIAGGRGQDGSPVITFPDYPAFGDVPDKEFQNVMTYLTSIPSLQDAGIGFILVIDRRQDKWTSVKASILRIAASFPANLQLVLVLRPTGFFQRTLSDLAFRFNRDDFKMKVPVIMLSSVPELHSYIDKSQLTEDLGGTLDYCHSRWLCHRTAIESFALLVKQTAQMLQAFGTELAETELPNDVQSTSSVLRAHTEKKDRAKEDMRLALDEGRSVLESIREPLARGPEQSPNQDQLDSQSTVQRLLAQLSETEAAFDEFWAKHQRKLEQCLQLRHFEQDFREVKAALDVLAQKITTFTDVGNSLAHVQHLLKDLASFEEKSSAVTQRARTLALEGERLIELKHYAVDSIRPKCHELRQLCDQFAADVGRRRGLLGRALDLHGLLEASMKWCDEGIYLLASQPVDKCQAQDGAEAALQEVEKFLETRAENKIQELSKIYQDYEPILTRDLLEHVQKVFRKQESVEEMFHRRQASLKKLAAKQTRPVQPVAPRPEAPAKSPCPSPGIRRGSEIHSSEGSVLRRGPYRRARSEVSEGRQGRGRSTGDEESLAVLRRHVMNELLDTERVYVEELLCILEGYAAEMDNPLMTHLISTGLQNKKDVLFGNMEEIYHFHNRIFLRELENYIDCPELVGRCFLERMEQFQVYEKYCQNKPRSESLWRQCSDCPFFQECQKKLDHKLSLDSYLLKPVQRITKYQLLLKEMLKYSKSCEGAEDLQEALSSILGILKAVNDSMHLIAITGYEGNLSDLGKLLMQGSFSVWTDHKKGHTKVKDLARFKPMQRHLFLHEKAVLFCKKREENGEGYEKAPSYSFKQSLNMTAVGITENVKGDVKKFEIWYNAREEVYIVQAPTPEIKAAWVSEIRKVLTSQLQACREASQHRALEQSHSLPLPAPAGTSPSKGNTKDVRKLEERKTDPLTLEGYVGPAPLPRPPEKGRDDAVTSSTSESSALSKKRFTLQSFAALKGQKASPTSPDKKAKRHQVKSDPTPFGLRGWSKTSNPPEAPEDNDGWSSAEEPVNSSDAEEEGRAGLRKLVRAERELRRRGLAAGPQPVRAPRPARRPRVPEQPRVQRGVRPAERLVQLQRELRGRPRGPAGIAPRPPRLRPWELASARAGAAWGGAGAHRTAHGTPKPPRPQTKVREESALRPRRRDRARAPGRRKSAAPRLPRGVGRTGLQTTDLWCRRAPGTPLRPRPQPLPFGFRRFWSGAFCRNTRSVELLPKEVTDSLTQRLGAGAGG
ncbi:guanine nucleotide exchange factor DBS isoform X2 [Lagenorhynchus albirostris]|uniref:guanine nucleotide exchange factor DBS isoform X2 n=1 Tax=Lagenorhynchus albirostris TaxID=27610 RepID=UPI0028ED186A|nr:guanine nucleotide exchange factor DBS isoform X2 [Lagenorhynchus albirostris]